MEKRFLVVIVLGALLIAGGEHGGASLPVSDTEHGGASLSARGVHAGASLIIGRTEPGQTILALDNEHVGALGGAHGGALAPTFGTDPGGGQ